MGGFRTPKEGSDPRYELAKERLVAAILVVGLVLTAALAVIWHVRGEP